MSNHKMTIIAKDGLDVVERIEGVDGKTASPVKKSMVLVHLGQRVDVEVECDQSADRQYMVFSSPALQEWYLMDNAFPQHVVYALLRYGKEFRDKSSLDEVPLAPADLSVIGRTGKQNREEIWAAEYGESFRKNSYVPTWEYQTIVSKKAIEVPAATKRYVVHSRETMPSKPREHGRHGEWWRFNLQGGIPGGGVEHTPFHPPHEPMLQTDRLGVPLSDARSFGVPVHDKKAPLLVEMELGTWNELVMTNYDYQQHPWHIHGMEAHVIGYGYFDTEYPGWKGPARGKIQDKALKLEGKNTSMYAASRKGLQVRD